MSLSLVLTVLSLWFSTVMAELKHLEEKITFIFGKEIQTFDKNVFLRVCGTAFLFLFGEVSLGKCHKVVGQE